MATKIGAITIHVQICSGAGPHALHTLGTGAALSWFKSICLILADNQIQCRVWAKFNGQSPGKRRSPTIVKRGY
ncbi:hypothetical protein NON20_02270 [Synechocystis sp. B12]|nr:hypothetical protein NON20_02270 [Synechocystis sp. B12]